jgi:hypothetical protein
MAVIKEMYPNRTAGEYGLLLNKTFDNTYDQDYIDFRNAFDKKISRVLTWQSGLIIKTHCSITSTMEECCCVS